VAIREKIIFFYKRLIENISKIVYFAKATWEQGSRRNGKGMGVGLKTRGIKVQIRILGRRRITGHS